jgi:predicted metal-dependent phosphoesterase TrpH
MERAADLHTHSTASDGLLAPADLVRQAHRQGLSVLALTDHDTTLGLAEALAEGQRLGLRLVPGIELSASVDVGQVHVLGYCIATDAPELLETLARLRAARLTRAERILTRLRDLGLEVPAKTIVPSKDGAAIGRPHIARALVAAGYVSSVGEAFERLLGEGRPAYVASERLAPADAVALIRRASGLPVLAHPLSSPDFLERLPELISAGLGGLEVYYGEYTATQQQMLRAVADEHGLLATGGSDYHGPRFKEGRNLGSVALPDDVLVRFLAWCDGHGAHGAL